MEDDGFVLVKSKKSFKSKNLPFSAKALQQSWALRSCTVTRDSLLQRIESCRKELLSSDFYMKFIDTLDKSLDSLTACGVDEIICFGLGNFSDSLSSQFQLALLLIIKQNLQIKSVHVHDPLFHELECDVLEHLQCTVIRTNEEGKHKLNLGKRTLAFFPHCPRQLTNNFLWANWDDNLQQCIIVANSFSRIIESSSKNDLIVNAGYIQWLLPFTVEYPLVNSFRLKDIFNDISVHVFPDIKSSSAQQLWNFCDEPKYCDEDIELISRTIISSLRVES